MLINIIFLEIVQDIGYQNSCILRSAAPVLYFKQFKLSVSNF